MLGKSFLKRSEMLILLDCHSKLKQKSKQTNKFPCARQSMGSILKKAVSGKKDEEARRERIVALFHVFHDLKSNLSKLKWVSSCTYTLKTSHKVFISGLSLRKFNLLELFHWNQHNIYFKIIVNFFIMYYIKNVKNNSLKI